VININIRIIEKEGFRVVGLKRRLSRETLNDGIGEMWKSLTKNDMEQLQTLNESSHGKMPMGVYANMYDDKTTDYFIAVESTKDCPEGFSEYRLPKTDWAICEITGALPNAIAEAFSYVFNDWLPDAEYEYTNQAEIEWYSEGDMSQDDYKSEIWIPVRKKS